MAASSAQLVFKTEQFRIKITIKKRSERRKHCACAGCSKVRTPPARRYNARPPQTGPITIHCAAKLSAQCNDVISQNHAFEFALSCAGFIFFL